MIKREIFEKIPARGLAVAALGFAAWLLLGTDLPSFLVWWLAVGVLGLTFMPLTAALFPKFGDKGWLFSKLIGLALCGYLTWLTAAGKILPFTRLGCMGAVLLGAAVNAVLAWRGGKKFYPFAGGRRELILGEEAIFFLAFLLWAYLAGFHPAAYGTEKFMDFGFMQAIMRSDSLPAMDLWYAQETINYYYGGQYFAVFLTKLTGTEVAITYNLMRALIAGFAFALPFSLVRQMLADRAERETTKHPGLIATLGGLLAGGAVCFSGNLHYTIYSKLLPWFHNVTGMGEETSYWFPNSTRYIGAYADSTDRTIHEFPSYSFVLGDLHAHVVNVLFVLTVVGVLYAWLRNNRGKSWLQPCVLLCGLFLGIFQFSNTWDFAIYFVVICGTLLFGNLKRCHEQMGRGLLRSAVQWVELLAVSLLVALPFHLRFDSGMAQGIGLVQKHSPLYQLGVLWGLPILVCAIFVVKYLWELIRKKPRRFFAETAHADMYAAILALCAMGLVLIPEIVYVRDIYEATAPRANTMFKLTYQAFMLFGIAMAYILTRLVTEKKRFQQVVGVVLLLALLTTFGYTGTACRLYYGNVYDLNARQTLDATRFLEKEFPEDAAAIRWLDENVEGVQVVLEANGDSYSAYNRVSAMTGLPTVLGWYVHEWLWRNDTSELKARAADIQTIYTSTDPAQVRALLKQYGVAYVFIGAREREKYPALNEELLRGLGTVVFDQGATIIKLP